MASYFFYILLVITFPIACYIAFRIKDCTIQIINTIVISVLYSLPLAFRGITGTDSLQYFTIYNYGLSHWKRWNTFEPGFLSLMDFCKNLHFPVSVFYFLISFISLLCFCIILYIEQDRIDIRIASFYYVTDLYMQSFNICRQILAVSLVFLALELTLHGKRIFPLLLIAFGMSFHISAAIGFSLYLLIIILQIPEKKSYSRTLIFVIAIVLLYCSIHPSVLSEISNQIFHSTYYSGYFNEENLDIFTFIKNILVSLPIIILLWLKINEKDFWSTLVCSLSIFGIIISSIGGDSSRIGLYMSIFSAIALASKTRIYIPYTCQVNISSVNVFIYIYYTILFVFHYFYKGYCQLIPYIPI